MIFLIWDKLICEKNTLGEIKDVWVDLEQTLVNYCGECQRH